jgi:hypothetical protein
MDPQHLFSEEEFFSFRNKIRDKIAIPFLLREMILIGISTVYCSTKTKFIYILFYNDS